MEAVHQLRERERIRSLVAGRLSGFDRGDESLRIVLCAGPDPEGPEPNDTQNEEREDR